ncbi:MAG: leucine-rich repeat domain-containing protein [Endomicrobium sp.]|jgi:hypothetical protein|nr:leucine-rich repeat domain-containing protein [Endomicrobium sp.]
MKKLLSLTLVLCCTLTFIACNDDEQSGGTPSQETNNSDATDSSSSESSSAFSIPDFSYKEINGGSEYEISAAAFFAVNISGGNSSKEVVIPSTYNGKPVTAIGVDAFKNHYMITRVTIPDSITVIEKSAFENCSNINSVILGNATTKIGDAAFYNCKSLNSINIPETLTYLGDYAFKGCSNLQGSITIPDGVTNSLKRTFADCSKLTSVIIGTGVPKIDAGAIAGSGITSITIPSTVKSIEDEAFRECTELISITIENDGVTHIEGGNISGAFLNCSKLKTVILGNKIEYIGEQAFQRCTSLETLTFPESLISINKSAFRWCSALVSIKFENSAASIGQSAFEYCTKLKDIDFGDSLVRISSYAFKDCTSITEITLPASLQYLGGPSMYPFMGCNRPIVKVKKLLSAPSGWASRWNNDCGEVYWGQ